MNTITALAVKTGGAVNAAMAGIASRASVARMWGADLNPTPVMPPGTEGQINTVLSWVMGVGLVAVLGGLIVGGIRLALNNGGHGTSEQGFKGIGVTIIAGIVISAAAGIAKLLVH
jgi:hypothetical protein